MKIGHAFYNMESGAYACAQAKNLCRRFGNGAIVLCYLIP